MREVSLWRLAFSCRPLPRRSAVQGGEGCLFVVMRWELAWGLMTYHDGGIGMGCVKGARQIPVSAFLDIQKVFRYKPSGEIPTLSRGPARLRIPGPEARSLLHAKKKGKKGCQIA